MIVLNHLYRTYRAVYIWFWAIMMIMLAGIVASFEIFGYYTLDDDRVSVWGSVGQQAPHWFVFTMGILFASVNLPVVIASGITRRVYYRGAMVFLAASAALFGLMFMIGFGVEVAAYQANGLMAEVSARYPLHGIGSWLRLAGSSVMVMFAYGLSGWVIGLMFYRQRVWLAIPLIPVALLPIVPTMFTASAAPEPVTMAFTAAAVAIAAVAGFLLVRTVPLRPKKA